MTNRALLLLGFLIMLLVSISAAHAETIPATSTETVVSDFQYHYIAPSPLSTKHASKSEAGNAYIPTINSTYGSCSWSYNAGNTNEPATTGSIYFWYDRGTTAGNCSGQSASKGFYGFKEAGCAPGSTPSNGKCVTISYTCPANQGWTLEGQSCTRVDCPYARNPDGTCQGQCDGKANTEAAPASYYSNPPSIACYQGCVAKRYTVIDGSPAYNTIVNGVTQQYGKYSYSFVGDGASGNNGVSCSAVSTALAESSPPAATANPSNIQQSCGSGQTGGYVNGTFVCVDNTTSQPVSESGPVPPQTTTSTTATNPDGSTTTTKTTTYPDGSKTVETTTTPSGGGNPSSSTTQHVDADGNAVNTSTAGGASGGATNTANVKDGVKQGLEQYCVSHPNSPVCKEEGEKTASGGTACDAAPSCNGDAIQCAVLYQQWKNRCETSKLNQALGEDNELINDLAGFGQNAMTGDPLDRSSMTESLDVSGQISTEKFLTGGCIPDKVITGLPMGKTITIPFSTYCPYIEYFGMAMIALAMLGAARITGVF